MIGLPLPDPLRESPLRHDGTGYRVLAPPFWMLLGTARTAESWRSRTRVDGGSEAADLGPGAEFGPWWHRRWIPFAADDCEPFVAPDGELGWDIR